MPVAVRYFPAPQLEQAIADVTAPYCPAGQLVHGLAPEGEYFPVGHEVALTHVEAPVVAASVQAPQATAALLGWKKPTLQLLQRADAEVFEKVPGTQAEQLVDTDVPVLARYRPAAHAVHAVVPAVREYVPAAQLVHAGTTNDTLKETPPPALGAHPSARGASEPLKPTRAQLVQ